MLGSGRVWGWMLEAMRQYIFDEVRVFLLLESGHVNGSISGPVWVVI